VMSGEAKAPEADPVTLSTFILTGQAAHPDAKGDMTILMMAIQTACKVIASAVRKAGIAGLYGLEGAVNVQGEDVKKLDIVANDNFINLLRHTGKTSVMVSEENPEAVILSTSRGKYVVVFDPLDGSSNIDCNVSVGSIFGIYRRLSEDEPSVADALQPGTALIAAGYAMYGSSTQMVLSLGAGVHIFTLDPSIGEFLLTDTNVRIPDPPQTIYSVNEGNWSSFDEPTKKFIEGAKTAKKPYSLRYVGSMVADVHRTLLYGGVFLYPATRSAPGGKLRLLYECNPMSFLMEQAGGMATTGTHRILDIVPTKIHERAPIILGCVRDVTIIQSLYAEHAAAAAAAPSGGAGAESGDAAAKKPRTEE